jgi:hypothetical protein
LQGHELEEIIGGSWWFLTADEMARFDYPSDDYEKKLMYNGRP